MVTYGGVAWQGTKGDNLDPLPQFPATTSAIPTAPYSSRPPSPPAIVIPAPPVINANDPIKFAPSYTSIDPQSLSAEDLAIITQNGVATAHDSGSNWNYEDRRKAQAITDWVYLGPSSVVRDKKWLQDNDITMLLAARDSRMAAARLMGVDRVAQELGLQAEHIDVSGHQELIRAFPDAIRKINDHMLRFYREQAVNNQIQDGQMVIDKASFRRGKVLVFCETGNDRSAGIVIAYMMSVFGINMVGACQFVTNCRFCVSLDEDMKHLLKNFEDILNASRMVHQHQVTNAPLATNGSQKKCKRGFEDTMDEDDEMAGTHEFSYDLERHVGRTAWAPFGDNHVFGTRDTFMGD